LYFSVFFFVALKPKPSLSHLALRFINHTKRDTHIHSRAPLNE
jgi:hypothetical protein